MLIFPLASLSVEEHRELESLREEVRKLRAQQPDALKQEAATATDTEVFTHYIYIYIYISHLIMRMIILKNCQDPSLLIEADGLLSQLKLMVNIIRGLNTNLK